MWILQSDVTASPWPLHPMPLTTLLAVFEIASTPPPLCQLIQFKHLQDLLILSPKSFFFSAYILYGEGWGGDGEKTESQPNNNRKNCGFHNSISMIILFLRINTDIVYAYIVLRILEDIFILNITFHSLETQYTGSIMSEFHPHSKKIPQRMLSSWVLHRRHIHLDNTSTVNDKMYCLCD